MDTVIKFKVPTLYDALQNGYEFTGAVKIIDPAVTQETGDFTIEYVEHPHPSDPNGEPIIEEINTPVMEVVKPARLLYQCECGVFCRPAELVDSSPFDGIPNDWACGGCREKQIRIDTKAEVNLIAKPTEDDFTTNGVLDEDGFRAADEQYYRDIIAKRHECARNFKKGLIQAHGAPKELLDVVGVIDKDKANRKLPPVAKAAAQVIPAANDVTIEMIDAGNGIQPGKKAKLGNEEIEVTEVNGNQVSVTRPNPVDHPAGEPMLFNIESES